MKRILIPTDFSASALQAFLFGLEISSKASSELVVLHVLDMPLHFTSDLDGFDYSYEASVIKDLEDKARNMFEVWKKKYVKENTRVKLRVLQGPIAFTIEHYIAKNKIDLVVMGTQGASGLKEFFVGSNTEKIVRYSKVPVIAVRKSVKLSAIKNIVVPTELKLNRTAFIKEVVALQKFFSAKIHLVYVNTPVHFKASRVLNGLAKDFVKHHKLKNCETHITNDLYEQDGIIAVAAQIPKSMIAMATNSRRGLAHFLMRSIAEDVVNHVECPIWTYTNKS